jgi:hypothetical protein
MKPFLIIFLLISTFCFSQKQYDFDYLIEYELTTYKDSVEKTIKRFYLTNSNKNNYLAVITELDSLNYRMDFKDENGLSFNVNFLKSDLNKAEFINVSCDYVRNYDNPFKFLIKEYDFLNLNDTIIDKVEYSRYKLTSIKPKKKKRKKLATEFYIIDKKTKFHSPIFYFPTAYEEWKSKKNIPNGIFKERYLIDFYGNLDSKEKLINYTKIDKKVVIKNECDYTKNK